MRGQGSDRSAVLQCICSPSCRVCIWSDLQDKLILLRPHPSSSDVVSHFDGAGRIRLLASHAQRVGHSSASGRPKKKSHPIWLCWHSLGRLQQLTEQLQMLVMYNYRSIWWVISQSDLVEPSRHGHPLQSETKNCSHFLFCYFVYPNLQLRFTNSVSRRILQIKTVKFCDVSRCRPTFTFINSKYNIININISIVIIIIIHMIYITQNN